MELVMLRLHESAKRPATTAARQSFEVARGDRSRRTFTTLLIVIPRGRRGQGAYAP